MTYRFARLWKQIRLFGRIRDQIRKRETAVVDDSFLVLQKQVPNDSADRKRTGTGSRSLYDRSVRRILKEVGLRSYVPIKAPQLQIFIY